MEEAIKKTLKNLKARNLAGWCVENCQEARDLMLDLIPQDAHVGRGNSSTIDQIGIMESLEKRGTFVFVPSDLKSVAVAGENPMITVFRRLLESSVCDVYLSGTNAVTQDGRLLNIDAAGNRVAAMAWGHPLVILVVGKNKIVKDLDEAALGYQFSNLTAACAPKRLPAFHHDSVAVQSHRPNFWNDKMGYYLGSLNCHLHHVPPSPK